MTEPDFPIPKFYSVEEVAKIFEVTRYTVREWIKNGTLDAVKPGRDYRISEAEVHRLAHERYGADAPH